MSLKLLDVEIVIGLHKECVIGICASFVNQDVNMVQIWGWHECHRVNMDFVESNW